MTTKEVKEKIATSNYREQFNKVDLKLNLTHLNFKTDLSGMSSIYEFVQRQISGFKGIENLPDELKTVSSRFSRIETELINVLENKITNLHTLNNAIDDLKRHDPKLFLYDSPETKFLTDIYATHPEFYLGSYQYIVGSISGTFNINLFTGYLMAYEFASRDFSKIVERKNADKKSIHTIRNDFQRLFAESQQDLEQHLASTSEKYESYSNKIDVFKRDREQDYTAWYETATNNFSAFQTKANETVKTLEDLYQEKLKLEAPAQYWNKRAASLKKEGTRWLYCLIVCLSLATLILVYVLRMTENGTLQEIFKEVGTAVKWTVVLISVISFLAFGIRTFSKLMFSSYHLSRDAEEREHLTYVYLSLQKEKAIDTTERHMIMQSLFSRADSGLLKDDSGPTMPGNIMDQITKGGR